MTQQTLKVIAMVAGEASGDTLGADLIQSLKKRHPNAKFVGIGGPKMKAQGFESWFPMEALSVMGFFEVLKHLPKLLKIRKQLIHQLLECEPDVFIGIDAPDFNFKVESTLKQNGTKSIHYVGPSVWAWREKRLNKIKSYVDGVLVLFPFELPYYERYSIPAKFVGHPLANMFPEEPETRTAKEKLGFDPKRSLTAILPGSRMSEVERMSDRYIQAAVIISQRYPDMNFVVPCVHKKARHRVQMSIDKFAFQKNIALVDGASRQVLEACDQALVTSGTSTLECALMKKPLVLAIEVHPISFWIMKKLATTKWIGLPNILAQKNLVKELIQGEASVDNIVDALEKVISDDNVRNRQIATFRGQYEALKQNASELASDAIEEWVFTQ